MTYSQTWLDDPNSIKGILAEIIIKDGTSGSPIFLYLSSMPYITTTGDVVFNPIISNKISFSETLSVDGGASISYSDIEIVNLNGVYDSWLDSSVYNWINGSIKLYYGDPRWICNTKTDVLSKFKLVFDGVISDIDSKSRNYLNIKLRDKLERLNTSITEQTVGVIEGWKNQPNIDQIVPLVFGEVFNYEPVLIDPVNLIYKFNQGPSERLIEVRDNGVPIYIHDAEIPENSLITGLVDNTEEVVSPDLLNSTFQLRYAPRGTITVSCQGITKSVDLSSGASTNTYTNNIANIIAVIVTQYGQVNKRLTSAEIDLINFYNFSIAAPYPVGYLVTDRENVIEVCNKIANSVGAQIYFNRQGKLQLLRIGVPTSDPALLVNDNNIIFDSFNISDRLPVQGSFNLAYAKNWVTQENLQTSITNEDKKSFSTEWYNANKFDETAISKFNLESISTPKETCLIDRLSAEAESQRLLNYFNQTRTVFSFTGTISLAEIKLGQQVSVAHSRFNLYSGGAGISGQVILVNINWLANTVEAEVLI